MELLSKEEELFLELLLEQDWENDIHAYFKFEEKLPSELKQQYTEIIQSLTEKGYIKKKRIRYFLLSESARNYKRDRKKEKAKSVASGIGKIIGLVK